MKKSQAIAALAKIRELSPKRKFTQSVELMVNFTGLDMKRPQNQMSIKVALPYPTGKGSGKVLVFAKSDNFINALKSKVDRLIEDRDIEAIAKDKVKLADVMSYDGLFAEGPSMITVAKFLGQQLAPKGKMPKLIPTIASFDETLASARTQITVSNKKGKFMPVVQAVIGRENMDDDKIADNIVAVYDAVLNALPQKKQNIKNAYIKMTMGPSFKVGDAE